MITKIITILFFIFLIYGCSTNKSNSFQAQYVIEKALTHPKKIFNNCMIKHNNNFTTGRFILKYEKTDKTYRLIDFKAVPDKQLIFDSNVIQACTEKTLVKGSSYVQNKVPLLRDRYPVTQKDTPQNAKKLPKIFIIETGFFNINQPFVIKDLSGNIIYKRLPHSKRLKK